MLEVCHVTFIVKLTKVAKDQSPSKYYTVKTNMVNLELLMMTELNSQNINYLRKKPC